MWCRLRDSTSVEQSLPLSTQLEQTAAQMLVELTPPDSSRTAPKTNKQTSPLDLYSFIKLEKKFIRISLM